MKVLGEMAQFGIVRFKCFEHRQGFKKWVEKRGADVKQERGRWLGDNVDKESRAGEWAEGRKG